MGSSKPTSRNLTAVTTEDGNCVTEAASLNVFTRFYEEELGLKVANTTIPKSRRHVGDGWASPADPRRLHRAPEGPCQQWQTFPQLD